jgi:hypothetical protein
LILKDINKGFYYTTGEKVVFSNAYAIYGDQILPYKGIFKIYQLDWLDKNKDIKDVKKYLTAFFKILFAGKVDKFELKTKRKLLEKDIGKLYNLDCIDKIKVNDYFCNKNIEYFLKTAYNIDLLAKNNLDYLAKIKETAYSKDLCKFIQNYIQKNAYFDKKLINFASFCSNYNDITQIEKIDEIISIFKDKGTRLSLGDKIYKDKKLDTFKLYSYWKYFIDNENYLANFNDDIKIYKNFLVNFIEEYYKDKQLMNKIYYYNNFILKDRLSDAARQEIEKINTDSTLFALADKLVNLVDPNLLRVNKKWVYVHEVPKTVSEKFEDYIQAYFNDKIILLSKIRDLGNILSYKVLINLYYENGDRIEKKTWEGVLKIKFEKPSNFYVISAIGTDGVRQYNPYIAQYLKSVKKVSL